MRACSFEKIRDQNTQILSHILVQTDSKRTHTKNRARALEKKLHHSAQTLIFAFFPQKLKKNTKKFAYMKKIYYFCSRNVA